MGNRNIVFHFLTVLLFSINIFAQDCNSGVDIPLSGLDYVGINLNDRLSSNGGTCSVIQGVKDDNSARAQCTNGYVINPGNPQYTTQRTGGTRTSNGSLNYYFCIKSPNFKKEAMCNELKRDHPELSVEWRREGVTDGSCYCGSAKSLQKQDCAQADITKFADQCDGMGTLPDGNGGCKCDEEAGYKLVGKGCEKVNDEDKACVAAGGVLKQFGGTLKKCYCEKEQAVFDPATEPKCGEGKDPGKLSDEVVKCANEKKEIFDKCIVTGKAASEKCEEFKKENKQLDSFKGIVKSVSDGFIGANQNKGAKTACVEASLIANGGYNILDMFKSECSPQIEECTKSCDEATKLDLVMACKHVAKPNISDDTPSTDMKYLAEKHIEFQALLPEAVKQCKVTAPKDKNALMEALRTTDEASKAAQTCACQLSSSMAGNMGGDCLQLPGPGDCATDPTIAGCTSPIFFNCNVGSPNYNSDACRCLRDPDSDKCKPVVTNAINPSNFGADIKQNTSGASTFGAASGTGKGIGSGGFDLGIPKKPVEIANASGVNAGGAAGVVAGGSSGGFSGGSAGGLSNRDPADGNAAADDANSDKGGVYGQAKSFFSSLLGNKDKDKKDANKNANKDKKPNLDGFRPNLRGVAGTGTGYGTKNMDIWKMVNHRYNEDHLSFLKLP